MSVDIEHFIEQGFVKLERCFTPEAAHEYSRYIWDRLGYAPNDRSTWARPSIHMASHEDIDVRTFAPKVWRAACELIRAGARSAVERLGEIGPPQIDLPATLDITFLTADMDRLIAF